MHENQDISSLVTNILMDEEKYSLSDWERKRNICYGYKKNTS